MLLLALIITPGACWANSWIILPMKGANGRAALAAIELSDDLAVVRQKEVELPPLHGRPPNGITFLDDDRIIISSILSDKDHPNDSLPWVSYEILPSQIIQDEPLSGLHARPSPFNSFLYRGMVKQIEALHDTARRELGVPSQSRFRPDANNHRFLGRVANNFGDPYLESLLLHVEEKDVPPGLTATVTIPMLIHYAQSLVLPLDDASLDSYHYSLAEWSWGRYLCILREKPFVETMVNSKRAADLAPGKRGLQALVYDITKKQFIFQSEMSFVGLSRHAPSISLDGKYVLWSHSDLLFDAGNRPHGDVGVYLYDLETKEAKRVTLPDLGGIDHGWFPDSQRFLFATRRTINDKEFDAYFMGHIHGEIEPLEFKLIEFDTLYKAVGSHWKRTWSLDGERYIHLIVDSEVKDDVRTIYYEIYLTHPQARESRLLIKAPHIGWPDLRGYGERLIWHFPGSQKMN